MVRLSSTFLEYLRHVPSNAKYLNSALHSEYFEASWANFRCKKWLKWPGCSGRFTSTCVNGTSLRPCTGKTWEGKQWSKQHHHCVEKKIWAAASINAVWRMIFHFSCGPMGGSFYIPHIPCKCHQRPNGQRCYTWNPFFLFQRVNQNFSPTCGPLGSGKPIFQAFPHSWEKNFQTFIFTKHANFQGQTSQKKLNKLISYLYQFNLQVMYLHSTCHMFGK